MAVRPYRFPISMLWGQNYPTSTTSFTAILHNEINKKLVDNGN